MTIAKTEVAVAEPAATKGKALLPLMAAQAHMSTEDFKSTVIATCSPSGKPLSSGEFLAFLAVANEYSLNPLTKEIYAFPAKGGGIVPIVGVDGWMNLINSHPNMDGMEFIDHLDKDELIAVSCKIYRKDRAHPTEVTEYMVECNRGTEPWKKWPRRMLRHKAAIQCARYAFGFAGIYDEDEGERIINVTPSAPEPPPPPQAAPVEAIEDAEAVKDEDEVAAVMDDAGVVPIAPPPPTDDAVGPTGDNPFLTDADKFIDDIAGQIAGATDLESLMEIWTDNEDFINDKAVFPSDRGRVLALLKEGKERVRK